ncbi:MAG: LamG-like jellyroll fold domain-containing protein, partial [Geminicoccaceae bacterium]
MRAAGCTWLKPADPISRWELDETSSAEGVFEDRGPAHVLMILNGIWADLTTGSLVEGVGGTSAYTDGSAFATIPANAAAHNLAALTISFYYQRNSAAAKHTLLAAGDGTQTGDFSIEALANGRLHGWHVGQHGLLRSFESTDGVIGTNLQVGTAYRIDLSLGSQGARIYLDGAELTAARIPENTNGWNNGRDKYLGRWTDGVEAPAVGALDRLRIWSGQLSDAEIALLQPPQSTMLPDLSAVPSAPAAGAYWVDPIDGNDSASAAQARSSTSFPPASPWKTLSRAIAQWNAGNLSAAASGNVEIILRGGLSYERGNNLTITRSATSG